MEEFSTPETLDFLLLGLGSVVVFTTGYVGLLFVRYQNLRKEINLIEELSSDD